MYLRMLKEKDAPLMLEWMHDPFVVSGLRTDFSKKTIDDCLSFIESSKDTRKNLHMAICDDDDQYMGTVSLKHIRNDKAEFGITVRREAMGKGYSWFGMRRIFEIGFSEYKLKEIYWCVDPDNTRACRFYDKHDFRKTDAPENDDYNKEERNRYTWYCFKNCNG